jgi:threonylcarbamoyladenosine tRNA methylthiotransferase MtaB
VDVERLVALGYREVVLTGIHLGHYGVEWSRGKPKRQWLRLAQLVERLAELPGEFRMRLSSIEATEVTRELVAVMAAHPRRICPHLHVSMQSGSDAVLRRMRRRWGSRRFVDRCRLVREVLDEPALTTDIIVGFPGESEEDFEATCRVAEEVGFSKIHIFPFSPRHGTPAATMSGQVAPQVKADRCRRLAELEARLRDRYFGRLLGRSLEVLVESPAERQGRVVGTSCRYAPVELPGSSDDVGRFVVATAKRVVDGRVEACRNRS